MITRFTLVGWAGKKLKLGVDNKIDYATLVASEKWPKQINGIDIEVLKPKYIPDSFVLVVRYVPKDIDETFVATEIQRTIASAARIKRIDYAYQRKTNDFRFDVKDYQEYSSALQLGRIAIGYSWLMITQFLSGNRLTYCTKCWKIGHLRNKCSTSSKCRICLDSFQENTTHECRNEPKCAQCDGNHHSLDNQCLVIQEYKKQLKEDVEEALSNGQIRRLTPKEQAPAFEVQDQDFPGLPGDERREQWRGWNSARITTSTQGNVNETGGGGKSWCELNSNMSKLMDTNNLVESKVDQMLNDMSKVSRDTQVHQAVLNDVINTMKDLITNFLPSSLTSNRTDRSAIIPVLQTYHDRLRDAQTKLLNTAEATVNTCSTAK